MSPKRIRMTRRRPWRAEHPDAVIVARPSKWGNPFRVGEFCHVWHRPGGATGPRRSGLLDDLYRDSFRVLDAAHAVRLFRRAMQRDPDWYPDGWVAPEVTELAGRDLACWCPLDHPCHADVLLEIANTTGAPLNPPRHQEAA